MIPTPSICPHCGKPVSANALIGLCPDCLLKAGTGTSDTESSRGFLPPTPGELARHFPQLEILELLGYGGMGAVYKARQKQLDRLVALKILPPGISRDPAFAERFAREARALARLHHPNIVTLYEFGEADGQFFFLMEFVDGVNLRQLLDAGRLAPKEALAIVPQICDALQFAHDQRIIHRDIKPENILLNKAGEVKIADFGVAKLVAVEALPTAGFDKAAPGAVHPDSRQIIGTPSYMAPEQFTDPENVDNRADIYALGVVFYQMLTGELPAGKFEPPSSRLRGVRIDVRLDEVVLRALEKEPDLRYQQVSEVRDRVQTIASTENAQAPVVESPAAVPPLFGARLAALFGFTFTSPLALHFANLSAIGFLGLLAFAAIPGWYRIIALCGLFGRIGVACIIESWVRWRSSRNRAKSFLSWLALNAGFLIFIYAMCSQVITQRRISEQNARAGQNTPSSMSLRTESIAGRDSPIPVTAAIVSQGDIPILLSALGTIDHGATLGPEQTQPLTAIFPIPDSAVQPVFKRFRADTPLSVLAYDRDMKTLLARGTLTGMDNRIDPETGTLNCKATLTAEGGAILLSGKFLNLSLLLETKHGVTLVPATAVATTAATSLVYVIRGHTVTLRPVTVGAIGANKAEITAGLSPGETVVLDPGNNLYEGAEVSVSPASSPTPAEANQADTKKQGARP